MVIAHHLVWTAYGTWLPNDLRGSGSRVIVSRKLAALGDVHLGRKQVQPRHSAVREFYDEAEPLLVHRVIRFGSPERIVIGEALAETIRTTPYTCWAWAVLPDHVHLVMRKHRHRAEEMIERLQDATREGLNRKRLIPAAHPVWTVGGWRVYLDSPERIRRTIAYVEGNPMRNRLPRQDWGFVMPYDGWSYCKQMG